DSNVPGTSAVVVVGTAVVGGAVVGGTVVVGAAVVSGAVVVGAAVVGGTVVVGATVVGGAVAGEAVVVAAATAAVVGTTARSVDEEQPDASMAEANRTERITWLRRTRRPFTNRVPRESLPVRA
ncbi:MAG: hypothetical protein ABGY25_10050, partial [Acidimicrobiales bacterium]